MNQRCCALEPLHCIGKAVPAPVPDICSRAKSHARSDRAVCKRWASSGQHAQKMQTMTKEIMMSAMQEKCTVLYRTVHKMQRQCSSRDSTSIVPAQRWPQHNTAQGQRNPGATIALAQRQPWHHDSAITTTEPAQQWHWHNDSTDTTGNGKC